MVEGDDLEIKHATFVRASADQVYNAFTTAEGLDAWFTKGAKVDPRPGGEILICWRDWGPDLVMGILIHQPADAARLGGARR